jgi:hypothetical protein
MGGGSSLLASDNHGVDYPSFKSLFPRLARPSAEAETEATMTLFDMFKDNSSNLFPMSTLVELNQIRDLLVLDGGSSSSGDVQYLEGRGLVVSSIHDRSKFSLADFHRRSKQPQTHADSAVDEVVISLFLERTQLVLIVTDDDNQSSTNNKSEEGRDLEAFIDHIHTTAGIRMICSAEHHNAFRSDSR